MKKIFHKLHLWLSVPFGLFISLICLSGASLVFEKEITQWLHPERYYVGEVGEKPLPVARLMHCAERALPDDVQATGITLYAEAGRTARINLSKHHSYLYLNPYTGEVAGESKRPAFFGFMFRLHRWMLGDAHSFGKTLVGISTLLFVIILLTGAALWWPKNLQMLKTRLSVCFTKGKLRIGHDLHIPVGMYALVFLLAVSLTGLTWSFPWYRAGVNALFGVETQQREGSRPSSAEERRTGNGREQANAAADPTRSIEPRRHLRGKERPADERKAERCERTDFRPHRKSPYIAWQTVYEKLKEQNPGFEYITLSECRASVSFNRLGNRRAADNYTFHAHNGRIASAIPYESSERSGKLRGWIYSIHVGSWGGLLTRLLTFFAALIGASLPVTGYCLWFHRSRHPKPHESQSAR